MPWSYSGTAAERERDRPSCSCPRGPPSWKVRRSKCGVRANAFLFAVRDVVRGCRASADRGNNWQEQCARWSMAKGCLEQCCRSPSRGGMSCGELGAQPMHDWSIAMSDSLHAEADRGSRHD
jgi:hypothetical protein